MDNIIGLLKEWKLDFPNGTNFSNPRVERTSDIRLNMPESPEPILLPLPPTRRRRKRQSAHKPPGASEPDLREDSPERALGKLIAFPPSQPPPDNAGSFSASSEADLPSEFDIC